MEIVIALIISGLTALFIALPFFLRSGKYQDGLSEQNPTDPLLEKVMELEGKKESLYSAIRDIDLDFGLGKLTKGDYDELRQKYRLEAAAVLRELDRIADSAGTESLDDEIEVEIKKSRDIKPVDHIENELEKEIMSARKPAPSEFSAPSSITCPECGSQITADDIFCSKCGAKLKG